MSDFWAHVAGRHRESQGQIRPRTAALFEPLGGVPPALPADMVEAETPAVGSGRPVGPSTGSESPVTLSQSAGHQGTGPGPAEDLRPQSGDRPPRSPSEEEQPGLWPPFRLDTIRATAAPVRFTLPENESGAGREEVDKPVAEHRPLTTDRSVPATENSATTADRKLQTADRPPAVRPAIIHPEIMEPSAEKAATVHPGQTPDKEVPGLTARPATGVTTRPAAIEPAVHPAIEDRPVATGGPPIIRVRIGRIEIKATAPARPAIQPVQPEKPYQPPFSLDDYLKQRSGGNA